jgi:hypothetical protein
VKETRRLGSRRAEAQANTWRTFGTVLMNADGSGYVRVVRDGRMLAGFTFGPEDGPAQWETAADG